MKKYIITLSMFCFVSSILAQNLTSKKGEDYLPKKGDVAIGLSATSFLEYAGNLFNSDAFAPEAEEPMLSQTVYGKMFINDNQAYRLTLGINYTKSTDNTQVSGLESDGTTTGSDVTNSTKLSNTMFVVGLGKEFRRGSTRLQGLYGAEGLLMFGGESAKYEYGNTIKAEANAGNAFSRTTEDKNGSTFTFMLRGFIGAEYFIAPKVSISAEYGWGIGFSSIGGGSSTVEEYDFVDDISESTTTENANDSGFAVSNDMGLSSGSLGLILHF